MICVVRCRGGLRVDRLYIVCMINTRFTLHGQTLRDKSHLSSLNSFTGLDSF